MSNGMYFPLLIFLFASCAKEEPIPTLYVDKVYSGASPLSSIYFTDAQHGFAGGQNGVILITNDGGASWTQAVLAASEDANFNCISFPTRDTGWISGAESNNSINQGTAIYKTYDGGQTWLGGGGGGGFDMLYSTFPTKLVGYRDNWNSDIEKTTNGGQSWNNLPFAPSASFNYQNLFFINKDTGFVGTTAQFRTVNGGSSWSVVQMPPDNDPAIEIDFSDNLHGVAVLPYGHIATTNDAGATWQESFSAFSNDYYPWNTVTMPTNDVMIAGGLNVLFVSVNGGGSWEQYFQQDGTSFPGEVSDIYFYDAYNGYAVTNEGSIYRLRRAQ